MQKPTTPKPQNPVPPEWQRIIEGLRKAQPMPDPVHRSSPTRQKTSSGELVRLDVKTGIVSTLPTIDSVTPRGSQRREPHPGSEPVPTLVRHPAAIPPPCPHA